MRTLNPLYPQIKYLLSQVLAHTVQTDLMDSPLNTDHLLLGDIVCIADAASFVRLLAVWGVHLVVVG